MIEYEDNKFIVINRKHLAEAEREYRKTDIAKLHSKKMEVPHRFIQNLFNTLSFFSEFYNNQTGKVLNQSYYVCNQDEPYAQKVIDVILEGEREKERKACNKAIRKRHS